MVQLEVVPAQVEALAQEAHAKIDQRLAQLGADKAAFWHAVALVYRRGLPAPVSQTAELGLTTPVRDHLERFRFGLSRLGGVHAALGG